MRFAILLLILTCAGATAAQQVPSVDDVYVSPRTIGGGGDELSAPIAYVRFDFELSSNVTEQRASGKVLQQVPVGDEAVPIRLSLRESSGLLGAAGGALVSDGEELHLEDWSTKQVRRLERSDELSALLDVVTLGPWAAAEAYHFLDAPDSPWRTVAGRPTLRHRVDATRGRHIYLELDREGRPLELRILRDAGAGRIEKLRLRIDELQPVPEPALVEFLPRG